MDKLSELFYDVGRLWNVYAPSYLNGVLNTLILAVVATLLGCVIGFLVYNHHPAKMFMGDTGSLFLGAVIMGCGVLAGE